MPAPPPTAAWSPVDAHGWPTGVSLERLRGLRPCRFGEVMPGPGEPIPCRPQVFRRPLQWRFGVDWTTGVARGDDQLTGGAQALGVDVDITLRRHLTLGVRYELVGLGLRTTPDNLATTRSQRFLGQVGWRLFTDEADRDAVALTIGGGYALTGDRIGGDGPVARAAISREVGLYLDDANAAAATLELGYTRTLGARPIDALMASVRLGFELGIVEPTNLDELDRPFSTRLWTGGDVFAAPFMLGLGVTAGYRLAGPLHAVASANFVFGNAPDSTELRGLHGTWAVMAGGRLDAGWPRRVPLYAEAKVGPGWVAEDSGLTRATLFDTELGIQLGGCDGAVTLGAVVRSELDGAGARALTGGLALRFALGQAAAPRGAFGRCGHGPDAAPVVYMPTAPPPPPVIAPPSTTTPPPPPPVEGRLDGAGGAGGSSAGGAAAGGQVVVVAPRPQPVVIDVSLGAVFLGGAIEVRIDPRLLPVARLRGVDVDVQVTGPAAQVARFEGELRGVLTREGVRVTGWSQLATSTSEIHAVFTIYPPGSR